MSAETTASANGRVARPSRIRIALAVVFGLFYAYDVWEVIESVAQIIGLGLGFTPVGWAIMVIAVLAPFACFAAAYVVGRRRSAWFAVVAYLAGLGVSAALFFSLTVLLGASGAVVV